MTYAEFVEEVRRRARIEESAAQRVVDGTIATFGERLGLKNRNLLGSQLTHEFKRLLNERPRTEFFDLEEFYNRVSARADIGYPDAVRLSQVVMGVLMTAASNGLMHEVLSSLPPQYGELFGMEPNDPLSPSRPRGA